MYFGRQTHVIRGITEWQQEDQKKETAGKLLTHIENAQKKYLTYLSEIRTSNICVCVCIYIYIYICNNYSSFFKK
jgi:hypothetical protein